LPLFSLLKLCWVYAFQGALSIALAWANGLDPHTTAFSYFIGQKPVPSHKYLMAPIDLFTWKKQGRNRRARGGSLEK
jgi:hypothetical protein